MCIDVEFVLTLVCWCGVAWRVVGYRASVEGEGLIEEDPLKRFLGLFSPETCNRTPPPSTSCPVRPQRVSTAGGTEGCEGPGGGATGARGSEREALLPTCVGGGGGGAGRAAGTYDSMMSRSQDALIGRT